MTVKLKKGNVLASLSITPLIDVVFLLLAFFLVATKLDEEDRALDIQLPQSVEATPIWSVPRSVIVNINRHGEYYISGEKVTLEELKPRLEQVCLSPEKEAEGPSVVIRGDERTSFGAVVAVADICQALELEYSTVTRTE